MVHFVHYLSACCKLLRVAAGFVCSFCAGSFVVSVFLCWHLGFCFQWDLGEWLFRVYPSKQMVWQGQLFVSPTVFEHFCWPFLLTLTCRFSLTLTSYQWTWKTTRMQRALSQKSSSANCSSLWTMTSRKERWGYHQCLGECCSLSLLWKMLNIQKRTTLKQHGPSKLLLLNRTLS